MAETEAKGTKSESGCWADQLLVGVASLSTDTTDLNANHSGMSPPPRSICLNLVPDSLSWCRPS